MYIDALSTLEIYVQRWFSTLTYGFCLSRRSIYTFSRLPLWTFDINLTRIRQGTFSDVVFNAYICVACVHAYSVDGR